MSRSTTISQDEAIGWFFFILTIIGVVLALLVVIILFFRFLFWTSVILFVASVIFLVISVFVDVLRCRDEDYFEGVPWTFIALFCVLVFWCSTHFSFVIGYGETADGIIKLNNQYKEFMGLVQDPQENMNNAVNQALDDSCKTLQDKSPCNLAQSGINTYQSMQDVEDIVDFISKIFYLKKFIFAINVVMRQSFYPL